VQQQSVLMRQKQSQPTTSTISSQAETKAVSGFRRRLSRLESLVLPQSSRQAGHGVMKKSHSEVKCASATDATFAKTTDGGEAAENLLRKSSGGALKRRLRSASITLASFTGMVRWHSE
ncbi:hypothetical protein LPJ73_007753, partial [Coemansia sp. RSA 2703]